MKDSPLSKPIRALVFYTRTFLIQAFVAIFGASLAGTSGEDTDSASDAENGETRLLNDFAFGINPYLFVLPYFTFVPLLVIVEYMIS